jgi:hypothetical protein
MQAHFDYKAAQAEINLVTTVLQLLKFFVGNELFFLLC